jgi:hypothetical protein
VPACGMSMGALPTASAAASPPQQAIIRRRRVGVAVARLGSTSAASGRSTGCWGPGCRIGTGIGSHIGGLNAAACGAAVRPQNWPVRASSV